MIASSPSFFCCLAGDLRPLGGRKLLRPCLSALEPSKPSKSDCGGILLFGRLGVRHNGVENVPGDFGRVGLLFLFCHTPIIADNA